MNSYAGMKGIQLFTVSFWPMVKAGLLYSIPMMLLSFMLGLIVALFVALGRMSRFKPLSWLCATYVWIIRGTPLLVQLFIIFYGLPTLGIVWSPFTSAIISASESLRATPESGRSCFTWQRRQSDFLSQKPFGTH